MTARIVVSRQGIGFTKESIDSMLRFAMALPKDEKNFIIWAVNFKSQDDIEVTLGGGGPPDHPSPLAIEDQVDGVLFYWYTNQSVLDQLRDRLCVDKVTGKPSRLIPLLKPDDS